MTGPGSRLGIDFGTSTTVAVLRRADGRAEQLLFDGSPLLPSAVLLGTDGRLYTGRDAAHLARSAPERLEPNPKRRIDERAVLLGDAEVPVTDLLAAVLGRVAAEAARAAGPVRAATLTHPVDWGPGRRAMLTAAAHRAGFADVDLIAEPVAAAVAFAALHGEAHFGGGHLLVYDLGAGTCDVTLLRRGPGGWEPVADAGLGNVGGLDVDAAIVAHLETVYGRLWTDPASRLRLWDDVRSAKEMLSRASGTVVMVPALGREVPLGREQLEELARPVLRPTVAMTAELLRTARVHPSRVGGVFLVGGSSRTPLVATLLHEALGIAPVVAEQPELVVANGALRSQPPAPAAAPAAHPAPAATAEPDPEPLPRVAPARRRRGLLPVLVAVVSLVVAFAAFATYMTITTNEDDGGGGSGPSVAPAKYDLTKAPEDLCAILDLTPFAALYETPERPAVPSRNVTGQLGIASCEAVRVHQKGAIRAIFGASVSVRADPTLVPVDYRQIVADTARVNDAPAAVPDLGEESVVFAMKDSSKRLATDLTLVVGVRESNLVWTLRLTLTRSDAAGWSDKDKQDLRDRLVAVTRTALPKVTAELS
ncbi:MAG TPA: Hsp70 family protein [Dactylosporangium sp.]|nr:Hsp70 family protein [Dactylosporangium sp.]